MHDSTEAVNAFGLPTHQAAEPTWPIAVIGIGCRFPGDANSPEAFWQLLANGVDAIRPIPPDRWNLDAYYDPAAGMPGKTNLGRGGFVEQIDQFDAGFFGISPREAAHLDPQQRLLLEVAWEAMEDGGQPLEAVAGSPTAVFVGISGTGLRAAAKRLSRTAMRSMATAIPAAR